MPSYRRAYQPGGTFFFTLVTDRRLPLFDNPTARRLLRSAIATARESRPFTIDALVLLPEHLHLMMTLPTTNSDYSTRIAHFKSIFTRTWLASGHAENKRSDYRLRTRRRGIWQPRFWEHLIRDEDDYRNHFDYVCYNPVKHGHCACPHAWPHSSFHRAVLRNLYAMDWVCACGNRHPKAPSFDMLPIADMELE
jgi:putative transposase